MEGRRIVLLRREFLLRMRLYDGLRDWNASSCSMGNNTKPRDREEPFEAGRCAKPKIRLAVSLLLLALPVA
jgi:hypothetical protein